jgi:outer membrane protein assembly factor BamB
MIKRSKQDISDVQPLQKPFRLLSGVVIVVLQWLLWLIVPLVIAEDIGIRIGVFGGLLGGLAVIVWWAFFSQAPRTERWGAVLLMIVAMVATSYFMHESIGTGMMGMMFFVYAIPVLSLAFVVWAVVSRRLSDRVRLVSMILTIFLACGVWTFLRSDGMASDTSADFAWRWSETAEERLLSQTGDELTVLLSVPGTAETGSDWPGFRGANRDGIIRGVQIETDWSVSPPVELWRRSIGPGCSSFAVRGSLIYTQEQRGDDEIVACYNLTTGDPVWRHRDEARFWDSHAGAGPRSTPTLHDSRVYTLGATGILNVLNAHDGSVVWSRNAVSDIDAEIPGWGITGSPLVVGDVIIIAVSGSLVAYDLVTGDIRWNGPNGGESYSSPHLLTIDSVEQVLLMSTAGVISMAPSDGKLLWEHKWPADGRIVQPVQIADGDLLLGAGGTSLRRIAVAHSPAGWTVEEHWTSRDLNPNHYDSVFHKGHTYGFKSANLVCIDIRDGKRKWKGGRYGGFLVLLADQDLLLVLSEKGEVVLVQASHEKFTELALLKAIEGKTWSHPVLANDVLIVRNNQEMVAFRLSLAGS